MEIFLGDFYVVVENFEYAIDFPQFFFFRPPFEEFSICLWGISGLKRA